jgi:hypothetical protein
MTMTSSPQVITTSDMALLHPSLSEKRKVTGSTPSRPPLGDQAKSLVIGRFRERERELW